MFLFRHHFDLLQQSTPLYSGIYLISIFLALARHLYYINTNFCFNFQKLLQETPRLVVLKYDENAEDYHLLPEPTRLLDAIRPQHNPSNQEYILEAETQVRPIQLPTNHLIYWSLSAPFIGNLVSSIYLGLLIRFNFKIEFIFLL